ncbi:hypothetical protein EDD21DRAFT_373467 [Dissophora ornata]|nr:hypothetical protein EDD21DRAFT_373467 [Dissophora ornata]
MGSSPGPLTHATLPSSFPLFYPGTLWRVRATRCSMSKSKAVHWPVLVANSLPNARSACKAPPPAATFSTISRQCSSVSRRTHPERTLISRNPALQSADSPSSCWKSGSARSKSTFAKQYTSRNIQNSPPCLCSCSLFSPFFPPTVTPRTAPSSRLGRSGFRQTRQAHSSSTPNSQSVEEGAKSKSQAFTGPKAQRQRKSRLVALVSANSPPAPISPPSLNGSSLTAGTLEKPKRKRQSIVRNHQSPLDYTRSPTATTTHEKHRVALGNFRLLIHSEHLCAQHLRSITLPYHQMLTAEHRISSSIVPPLPALQQLYSYLESSNSVDQLTEADWNSFIFWLSHHNDYRTMTLLHLAMLGDSGLAEKCSTTSYYLLTEARLRALRNEPAARKASDQPGSGSMSDFTITTPTASSVLQSTIDRMEEVKVPRSLDLYGLWIRAAVQEENWQMGIEAWKRLKAERKQLPDIPIAPTAHAIQCYLHIGNMAETKTLLESVLDRSAAIQQQQSYINITEGAQPEGASAGGGEGEWEAIATDERQEFLKRQRQTMQYLAALQQKTAAAMESNWVNAGSSSPYNILEWKAVVDPALIEAVCLDENDKNGSALVSELALDLFKQGHVLDRNRFRYLTRYVGACNTSEGAETFLRRLVEFTKSASLSLPTSSSPSSGKNEHNSASTPPIKDTRKMKKIIESTTKMLVEVGLQEIVKQASAESDFDRAQKIFQGMAAQEIPLSANTSEKLIVGLTKHDDFRSALEVLDKSLQDKRVPSVDTANIVLEGLIKGEMLGESVAVFRDLTENHGLKPNVKMYRNLLKLSATYGQLSMTQRIMSALKGIGVKQDGELYRDLMRCYVRLDNLQAAIKVFEDMDREEITNEIMHINVLLEGAVRYSSPATVIGILEIMSSQRIHPNPETWNILLSGAFRAKDRILAQELYQELSFSVVEGAQDRADGALRASRHPETFHLLMNEYAERHGIDPALRLLKGALDARYPSQVSPSMYRDLMQKSCEQGKGVAGFEIYQLLRQTERVSSRSGRRGFVTLQDLDDSGIGFRSSSTRSAAVSSSTRSAAVSTTASASAITSASPSAVPPTLVSLYGKVMMQLSEEGQVERGREMATDLILSGFEMDQNLIASAIKFYARSGELAAAFGLFLKMGKAYGVGTTREMVQTLYEASRAHGLSVTASAAGSSRASSGATAAGATSTKWDDASTQLWMKALRASMEQYGVMAGSRGMWPEGR